MFSCSESLRIDRGGRSVHHQFDQLLFQGLSQMNYLGDHLGLKQYLKNLFKSIHLIFFAKKLNIYCYMNIISLTRFLM